MDKLNFCYDVWNICTYIYVKKLTEQLHLCYTNSDIGRYFSAHGLCSNASLHVVLAFVNLPLNLHVKKTVLCPQVGICGTCKRWAHKRDCVREPSLQLMLSHVWYHMSLDITKASHVIIEARASLSSSLSHILVRTMAYWASFLSGSANVTADALNPRGLIQAYVHWALLTMRIKYCYRTQFADVASLCISILVFRLEIDMHLPKLNYSALHLMNLSSMHARCYACCMLFFWEMS